MPSTFTPIRFAGRVPERGDVYRRFFATVADLGCSDYRVAAKKSTVDNPVSKPSWVWWIFIP